MKLAKYEETIERLKPHLVDYLEEHGLSARNGRHFKCLNPNQHDTDGDDMSVHPEGHVFHCFGCNLSGNIMLAAHLIEGKPIHGKGYITDNVVYLCGKYNVPVEFEELTDDEKYELDIYRAYGFAASLISRFEPEELHTEAIKNRGWDLEFCRKHQIGSVISYEGFREALKSKFPASFIDEVDLGRRALFNPNCLIFTVHDENGRPVGFAARDLLWEEKIRLWEDNGRRGRKPPKYINITTSGTRNIYQKSNRLYGFSHYLRTRESAEERLYVFEGYTDWCTAVFNGLSNAAALGGVALTRNHVSLLSRTDVRKLVLVLDGDEAGQGMARKLLMGDGDKAPVLAGVTGLKIEVVTLPEDKDPDDFIREEGVEKFKALEHVEGFEWVLRQFDADANPVEVCEKVIPLILGEQNLVRRESLCKILSESTGITIKTIQGEIERQLAIQENDLSEQKKQIVEDAFRDARRNPETAEMALETARARIEAITGTRGESAFSVEESVAALDQMKLDQEERGEGLAGFCLENFKDIEKNLNGDWKEQKLLVIGGRANTGKTALMANLSLDIARSNPDDTIVIAHTIDDTRRMFTNRWLTILGEREAKKYGLQLELNKMSNPNYWVKHVNRNGEHDELMRVRENAYSKLRKVLGENLVCKDSEAGNTLAYGRALVQYYRRKYPDKFILYFLDNFHKLQDAVGGGDERVKWKNLSGFVKQNIAQKLHASVVATMEYTKMPPLQRPSINDLAESVAMQYDTDFVGHLFSEVDAHTQAYGNTDKVKLFHGHELGVGEKKPTIEFIWDKNKISGFKNKSTHYDFHPEKSLYLPVDIETIRERIEMAEGRDETEENGRWVKGEWVEFETKQRSLMDDVPF